MPLVIICSDNKGNRVVSFSHISCQFSVNLHANWLQGGHGKLY